MFDFQLVFECIANTESGREREREREREIERDRSVKVGLNEVIII